MQLESELFLGLGVYNKSVTGKAAYDRLPREYAFVTKRKCQPD